jgi:hypothetical protein
MPAADNKERASLVSIIVFSQRLLAPRRGFRCRTATPVGKAGRAAPSRWQPGPAKTHPTPHE